MQGTVQCVRGVADHVQDQQGGGGGLNRKDGQMQEWVARGEGKERARPAGDQGGWGNFGGIGSQSIGACRAFSGLIPGKKG